MTESVASDETFDAWVRTKDGATIEEYVEARNGIRAPSYSVIPGDLTYLQSPSLPWLNGAASVAAYCIGGPLAQDVVERKAEYWESLRNAQADLQRRILDDLG